MTLRRGPPVAVPERAPETAGQSNGHAPGSISDPSRLPPIAVLSGRRRIPLYLYFVALALILVLTGASAGAYLYVQMAADAQQTALVDATFAARKAALLISSGLDIAKGASLSETAATFTNPANCHDRYAPIGAFDTGRIDVVRLDGSVVCSSQTPAPSGRLYAGQSWLQTTSPAYVAPARDQVTGKTVAVISYPVADVGVIAWFFDLDAIGPKLAAEFGSGVNQLEFLVTSSDGKAIIARSIDSAKWTGASIGDTPFGRASDAAGRPDVAGTPRWYGEVDVAATGWKVYVGAEQATALAATGRYERQAVGIIFFGALAVLSGLLLVYRRVVRPVVSLSAAVRSSNVKHMPTLVRVEGPAEVARLAEDVNSLVMSVDRELAGREGAERNYRLIFEGSPLPMMFTDHTNQTIIEANSAAMATYGYSRDEFVGLVVSDIVVPTPNDGVALTPQGDQYSGDVMRYGPVSTRKKDGTVMQVLITSFRVPYAGRPARFSIVEDVTEKERMERQHHQAQRLESLGQLAGGVAHDFNNLLGVILNFTLFVKETVSRAAAEPDGDRWQPAAKDLERVVRATESATRLTHQLLAFARREVVRPQSLNVNSVVAELEPLLRRTLGEHIDFVTSSASGLRPALIDPGQLEQVITNLAVNARDAMRNGGKLTIDTANIDVDEAYAGGRPGLKPGRYVQVRVTDTGSGMDRATLQRAFEPFFTTKPKGQGTGLGLATVHGIVNQAGGYVGLYSEPGLGTRVTVLLPATDLVPVAEEPAEPAAIHELAGETILVVEDDDELREVVERILAKNGYEVISAGSGPKAIEAAREHHGDIDLLLTDVVMPQMQGSELARLLTAERPELRVLFMSGYAEHALGASGTLEPGAILLEKPFTEPTVLALVRRVLEVPR
jgi:PAS domain S-box-containing protein